MALENWEAVGLRSLNSLRSRGSCCLGLGNLYMVMLLLSS